MTIRDEARRALTVASEAIDRQQQALARGDMTDQAKPAGEFYALTVALASAVEGLLVEQADREPSALRSHVRDLTGETDEGLTELGGFRGERHDSTDNGSVAPPSDAEVEAAARAMFEHREREWGRASTRTRQSWKRTARHALLATQEVRNRG